MLFSVTQNVETIQQTVSSLCTLLVSQQISVILPQGTKALTVKGKHLLICTTISLATLTSTLFLYQRLRQDSHVVPSYHMEARQGYKLHAGLHS